MLEDVVMLNLTKNGDELIKAPGDFPAIVVITCMLSVFSVVGTTGNAFVLYVFSKKKDKNTSTVFILALASIDFVTCIFVIPFTIFVEFMYKKVDNDAVCKIYQFFITSNVPFSAFIMVAIAIDRYLCICRPWVKIINIKVAKRIIMCLLVLSLSLGLITSLAYGVYHRRVVTKQIRNVTSDLVNEVDIVGVNDDVVDNCNEGMFGETPDCVLTNISSISHIQDTLTNTQLTTGHRLSVPNNTWVNVSDFVYTGFCFPNEVILSVEFRRVYQKIYATLFLIAFIIVFILYAWIYQSILTRRSKRLQSSLTGNRPGQMRSTLLASIFRRKSRKGETIVMVANNADVNKNNQENGKVSSLHQMRSVAIETNMPVSEITYCGHDDSYRTEVTRATSTHSLEYASHQEDISHCVDNENSDETSPLNENENKLQITSNNLSVPIPSPYNKRKRGKKNGNMYNGLKHKQTNKQVRVYDDVELKEGVFCDSHKDNYRSSTCNVYRQDTRKSVREKNRLANIKTAGILFIVTIVFVIAFLPAWLMATKIIVPPNMIIFYTYFIYNVANPVIYAFFNQSFQKEMKTYFNCSS